MDLDEQLAKELLGDAGIAIPDGRAVATADDAARVATELGGPVVVKPLLLTGRRGKAGLIRFAATPADTRAEAVELLSLSGVSRLRVERRVRVLRELYLSVSTDRSTRAPRLIYSEKGGVDVESSAGADFVHETIDIRHGPRESDLTSLPLAVRETFETLYRFYRSIDAELIEINPLGVKDNGELIALDAKLVIDDSALWRHPTLALPPFAGTALERRARDVGLYYVELGGSVGVLANGAGLTMATLDAIRFHGGRPANFMEIGGDAYLKATEALTIVLDNSNVRSLLVNLCGAYARTDVMIDGFLDGWRALGPQIPVSFSIHGTGRTRAIARVRDTLHLEPHDRMDDAVKEAVRNA